MFKDVTEFFQFYIYLQDIDFRLASMLSVLLSTLLFLYILYMIYILVMGIYRAKLQNKLNRLTLFLCFPCVVLGFILDVFANLVVVPFIFLELPQEWLVTTRLTRHLKTLEDKRDWRYKISQWICGNLLDIFDPTGCHCI